MLICSVRTSLLKQYAFMIMSAIVYVSELLDCTNINLILMKIEVIECTIYRKIRLENDMTTTVRN